VGIREWLARSTALSGTPAATFDTKVAKRFAGSAARKAYRPAAETPAEMRRRMS
jgi:hypothetical protein